MTKKKSTDRFIVEIETKGLKITEELKEGIVGMLEARALKLLEGRVLREAELFSRAFCKSFPETMAELQSLGFGFDDISKELAQRLCGKLDTESSSK